MTDPVQTTVDPINPYPANVPISPSTTYPPAVPVDVPTPVVPPPVSGGDKEAEPLPQPELVPLVELKENEDIPEEVEGWLEHLKQDHVINLPTPIVDEDENVLLHNAHAEIIDDKIVLPLTQAEMQQGLHAKVLSSARWLAEWSLRIMKIFGNRAEYRKE